MESCTPEWIDSRSFYSELGYGSEHGFSVLVRNGKTPYLAFSFKTFPFLPGRVVGRRDVASTRVANHLCNAVRRITVSFVQPRVASLLVPPQSFRNQVVPFSGYLDTPPRPPPRGDGWILVTGPYRTISGRRISGVRRRVGC